MFKSFPVLLCLCSLRFYFRSHVSYACLQVIYHLNADIIRTVPYFMNKDTDFVLHVVSLLRPQYAAPGEFLYFEVTCVLSQCACAALVVSCCVCLQGDVAWEMFFLLKGTVELLTGVGDPNKEAVTAVMEEGSYFGELALLMGVHRSTSARVSDHSNLFVLSKVCVCVCVFFADYVWWHIQAS